MERQVGIGSAAAALEPHLRTQPAITWTDVTYAGEMGWLERIPLPERARGTLRGFLQTGATLRKGPYDALFFLTHNPAVLRPRAVARTPTVLWTDVTPALLDAQAADYAHDVDRFRPLRVFKSSMVRRTFQRAARCVGWSEWARRSFVRDYAVPEDRTLVIPPGVDIQRWQAPARSANGKPPRILFVGGDFKRKGGDLLLDVFRRNFSGRATIDIVTRDAVDEQPGVTVHHGLTPASPALLELYRRADCFVLPTRGDCFSIASLEAMAAGLPVVTSRIGGIPDIVEEGASGYLVTPGDGEALASSLESLLTSENRRQEFGARGRAIAETRFDAKKSAERLLEILNQVAREGART